MRAVRVDTAVEILRTKDPWPADSCVSSRSCQWKNQYFDSKKRSLTFEPSAMLPFPDRASTSNLCFSLAAVATNQRRTTSYILQRDVLHPCFFEFSKFLWPWCCVWHCSRWCRRLRRWWCCLRPSKSIACVDSSQRAGWLEVCSSWYFAIAPAALLLQARRPRNDL